MNFLSHFILDSIILVVYHLTSQFVDSMAIQAKYLNFIHLNNKYRKYVHKEINVSDSKGFNQSYTLDQNQLCLNSKDDPSSSQDVLKGLKKLLLSLDSVNSNLEISSTSRLELNKGTMIETFKLSKETDMKVCKNDYSNFLDKYILGFRGDDEDEFGLVSKSHIEQGNSIVEIPLDCSFSLYSIVHSLISDIKSSQSFGNSKYSEKLSNFVQFTIGDFITLDKFNYIPSNYTGQLELDGFEKRMNEFITFKKVNVLRCLALLDSVLDLDYKLMPVIDNPYMKFNSLNLNEKEVLLLTLGMASEYYFNLLSSIVKCLSDNCNPNLPVGQRVKSLWSHYLFTRKNSHIPLMLDKASFEQIQEPIVKYKVSQRKLALQSLIDVLDDPINLVRSKLESISASRSMFEDRSCDLFYSSNCDLKSKIEEKLEIIEHELLNFDLSHEVFSNNPFSITLDEFMYIINGKDGTNHQFPDDKRKCDSDLLLHFFKNYLLDNSDYKALFTYSTSSIVSSLNSLVNFDSISNFFSSILSHAVRPGKIAHFDEIEASFLSNSAPGIRCNSKLDDFSHCYIIPLITLSNHSGSNPNSVISVENEGNTQSFSLEAKRDMGPEEPILISYGDYDNNVLFLDYGFVSVDDVNNWTLMCVDGEMIRESARIHDTEPFLPSLFPEGLPKEKADLVEALSLLEFENKGDLSEIYKNPFFQGLPFLKFMEFNQRFMANEQSGIYYSANTDQDKTKFVDSPVASTQKYCPSTVKNVLRVDSNGVPDPRLIVLLKVILCKTAKKLNWLREQSYTDLSTSVNSPIDYKAFEMASSIPLLNLDEKYRDSLFQDYGKICTEKPKGVNALCVAHAMRRKIPLYKCSKFYKQLSKVKVTGG